MTQGDMRLQVCSDVLLQRPAGIGIYVGGVDRLKSCRFETEVQATAAGEKA